MDWKAAAAELGRKLDPAHVKSRKQGGSQVSYVEAWHAIAEANRIFGFDAWTRETVDLRCVAEGPRTIGKPPYEKPGFGVSYIARVRVTVDSVVREGCGAGHGIDADLGAAHESALKEAESDAMKRAMMTFGNPFGLALYDKNKENVGVDEPETPPFVPSAAAERIKAEIGKQATLDDLFKLKEAEKERLADIKAADKAVYDTVVAAFTVAINKLKVPMPNAQMAEAVGDIPRAFA